MKKRWFVLTAVLTGSALLALGACGPKRGSTIEAGSYRGVSSVESVYAVGAVTTAKLLFAESGAAHAASVAMTAADTDADYGLPETGGAGMQDAQNAAADFNKYFNMLDSFLDKAQTTTVVEANTSDDAAVKDYEYKLTVTGKDASGADVTHIVYFTETQGATSVKDKTDGTETTHVEETKFDLAGAVDMGTAEDGTKIYYVMTGSRVERIETESEDGETETETTSALTMKVSESATSQDYAQLTHTASTEQDGTENETESLYRYSLYTGGTLTESTEVAFESEQENGGVEAEYTVRFLTGASRGTYEIERETKGQKTWIAVEYTIDGNRGKFVIVQDGDEYRYKFTTNEADDRNFRDFDD